MRRVLNVVLGLCLFASACSGGSDVARTTPDQAVTPTDTAVPPVDVPDPASQTPGQRQRSISVGWEAVVVDESANTATLTFTGGSIGDLDEDLCAGEYETDLTESDDGLRVTIYSLSLVGVEPVPCLLLGSPRELTVDLGGPLAGRALIDGHDGSTKLAADPSQQVPEPTPVAVDEGPEIAWSASESTRDVANFLEALRQGAYEQAAWPAYGNGILFEGQSADETGAAFLARMCGGGLCNGPFLVRGQEAVVSPETAQGVASVTVAHFEAGERTVITLVTFEGQRVIAQLPPLVTSTNEASLRASLFGNTPPQHVVVERFDAFEIWDGASTTWVTNWYSADAEAVEGDTIASWSTASGLTDPQQFLSEGCPRLMERDGDVLVLESCGDDDPWTYTNVSTGELVEPPLQYEALADGATTWFVERGGSVLVGEVDTEGLVRNIGALGAPSLSADDAASQIVLSTDGEHVAYIDHNDPAATLPGWSPVVVVRNVATGDEVGRWELAGSVTCLDFAVAWLIACEANDATLESFYPDQAALVAINPTTGELNRVTTPTRVFLPVVPPPT